MVQDYGLIRVSPRGSSGKPPNVNNFLFKALLQGMAQPIKLSTKRATDSQHIETDITYPPEALLLAIAQQEKGEVYAIRFALQAHQSAIRRIP